jgi:hypothetical protein
MRVLIDILHPAHVHFFKHFIADVEGAGHEVFVTARDKEMTLQLLDRLGIEATVLSTQRSGVLGLGGEFVSRTARLLREARRTRPDVMIGIMGPSIAPVGRLLRIPTVVFYDTETAGRTNRWVYPMASSVCTPDCYAGVVRGHHHTYPGYHELAYLHPHRFTADPGVLDMVGLTPGEPFGIVRFVGWQASHDLGRSGLAIEAKRGIVDALAEHGRVLISSESELPADLESRRVPDEATHLVHHLAAAATVLIGDSATMAAEAAVLGVPAVYVSPFRLGYTTELEQRYGLLRTVVPGDLPAALGALEQSLALPTRERARRRDRLLADKIDTTAWMVGFVTNRRWER